MVCTYKKNYVRNVLINFFPFLSKKEPVGNDESIPEDVLNLDDLTADTLTVSYCPFLGWDCVLLS